MATVIICPACKTRYETKAVIPPEGRKVRCSKCGNVWQATAVVEAAKPRRAAAPGHAPPLRRAPLRAAPRSGSGACASGRASSATGPAARRRPGRCARDGASAAPAAR